MMFGAAYSYAGEDKWIYMAWYDTYQQALDKIQESLARDERKGLLGDYDYRVSARKENED